MAPLGVARRSFGITKLLSSRLDWRFCTATVITRIALTGPRHLRVLFRGIVLTGLSLAAGCAVERGISLPSMDDWEGRRAVLAGIDDWAFSGRIGVVSGDDGFNGRLRWRQVEESFEASVSGPLGAGAVQIEGDGGRVTVTESDGTVTVLDDPEFDLAMRYGWTIPVESLRYWALGIPDPELPAAVDLGEDGNPARLEQGGWVVDIAEYREGGGQPMPRRITAENLHSRVRLIIDNWVFY